MRKFLIISILAFVGFSFLIYRLDHQGNSHFMLCTSQIHLVQKGDTFNTISLRFYDTEKYSQELALFNLSKQQNKMLPGEQIIIPDKKTIQKFHENRKSVALHKPHHSGNTKTYAGILLILVGGALLSAGTLYFFIIGQNKKASYISLNR